MFSKKSDCAIEIASGNPYIVDRFSYEMVRSVAIDIVEACQDVGGFGGWSPIGNCIGW